MSFQQFSFADHAPNFDGHIRASIRGLDDLRDEVVNVSRYHVQSGTFVVDIGCSEGTVLRSVRDANRATRPGVRYLGIDVEPSFEPHWRRRTADDLEFRFADARSHRFEDASLVISLFTLQFIPARDRVPLLRRVHDGLVDGGALIIAEKVLAGSARFQEILMINYYNHKLHAFSAGEILKKALDLRGMMDPWEETRLLDALRSAGFGPDDVQHLWRQHGLFGAWLARKGTSTASMSRPARVRTRLAPLQGVGDELRPDHISENEQSGRHPAPPVA
jgi:tRNA (cmo5U34)-methyltransferase